MKIITTCLTFFLLLSSPNLSAQTAYIGDRFGGRLWYYPTNFSVGSYSAHTVCGENNQLYSWGTNAHGELGFANMRSTRLPIEVKGMNNVNYYSAGYVAGAIKYDSTGWVWGKNFTEPAKVIDSAIYLDAGERSVCFIKSDSTVWSIGNSYEGTFGNGSLSKFYSAPVKMDNINSAVRVANGYLVSLILLKNGRVMACGSNSHNGLGNTNSTRWLQPQIIDGLENIVAIAASRFINLALNRDGEVFIWGYGHGHWKRSISKVESLKNIVAISCRNDGAHFMALDSAGNCYTWGHNFYLQLGTGNYNNYSIPQLVATNVLDILAGESFSYIIKKDWTLWATGSSKGGSIWLSEDYHRQSTFTQINLNSTDLGICNPVYAKFKNFTYKEIEACQGDTVFFQNTLYTSDTVIRDSFKSVLNHDSVINTSIYFTPKVYDSLHFTLCANENLIFENRTYNQVGRYTNKFVSASGCDSIQVITIDTLSRSASKQIVQVCKGDSFYTAEKKYLAPGKYVDILTNHLGCDSLQILIIDELPNSYSFRYVNLCPQESHRFNNNIYDQAGLYLDIFTNFQGCDSIVQTEIFSKPEYSFTDYAVKCPMDTLRYHGQLQIALGQYDYTFYSEWGCDSVHRLVVDSFEDNRCYYGITFIPNAFTPNGDLQNDEFGFVGHNIIQAQLYIFNRWGELVYMETSPNPRWNGTRKGRACNQDVYLYKITTLSKERIGKTYTGTVTLIRR